jgi:hypothetical protein
MVIGTVRLAGTSAALQAIGRRGAGMDIVEKISPKTALSSFFKVTLFQEPTPPNHKGHMLIVFPYYTTGPSESPVIIIQGDIYESRNVM